MATIKNRRDARKANALRMRLLAAAAAAEADKGSAGTDVTEMSSKDFIAFLRSR